jgi:hypothetical protein
MLVYCFVPFIANNRYLLVLVSSGHNSVTVQTRTHVRMNFLLRITHTIIPQSSADSSWITLYIVSRSRHEIEFLSFQRIHPRDYNSTGARLYSRKDPAVCVFWRVLFCLTEHTRGKAGILEVVTITQIKLCFCKLPSVVLIGFVVFCLYETAAQPSLQKSVDSNSDDLRDQTHLKVGRL